MNDYTTYTDKIFAELESILNKWKEWKIWIIVIAVIIILFCWWMYESITKENEYLKKQISTYQQYDNIAQKYFPDKSQTEYIPLLIERFDSLEKTLKESFPNINPLDIENIQNELKDLHEIKKKFDDLSSQRTLSDTFISKSKILFQKHQNIIEVYDICVGAINTDRETIQLKEQFIELLNDTGWSIETNCLSTANPGEIVLEYPPKLDNNEIIVGLKSLLEEEGFLVIEPRPKYRSPYLYIGIGVK